MTLPVPCLTKKGFLVTVNCQLSKLIFILKMFTLLVKQKVCLIIFSRQAADPVWRTCKVGLEADRGRFAAPSPKSTHRGVKSHRAGRGRAEWGQILKIWQNFLQLTKLSRTPEIVSRIINFNQTMPIFVLDLESFSMCSSVLSHIGLEASWPVRKADVSLSLIGENCWCPCSWWEYHWSFGWWREWRTVFSPLCKCMPFPIYRILKAFIWDQTEQQHLLWNIIFSLSFITLQKVVTAKKVANKEDSFPGHPIPNVLSLSSPRSVIFPPPKSLPQQTRPIRGEDTRN